MMCSGNNKKLVLAVLFLAFSITAASAQTLIPSDMLGQSIKSMAYRHIPQDEFNRAFQNFIRSTYPGRNSFYQSEIEGVTSSFVLYLFNNGYGERWRQYTPRRETSPSSTSTRFPATHRLTDDLKLFAEQDSGSTLVASLARGTAVQVESWGAYAELNSILARWARVKTEKGETGWLWSGYLEEVK